MDNRFKITIEAVDRATKKIRDIKKEFSKFTKPISQMSASLKRLGKELGVDKIAKSVGTLGKVAVTAVGKIAALGAAIAGVVGVGSVVALAAYVREWVFAGAAIARTARIIGIGSDKLQSLELASQMAGLQAGTLTSSIKTLGDTMEDALYGRNQDALVVLNRLHVAIRKTKDGSIDVARALPDIADGISRIHNAQARSLAARTLGIEGLLPFLTEGRRGIAEYERLARKTGAILTGPALAGAEKFQRSIVTMKMSLTGLGNQVMSKLGPALMPFIDKFTTWLNANRDMIASGFVNAVKTMATALSQLNPKDLLAAAHAFERAGKALLQVMKPILWAMKAEDWLEGKWHNFAAPIDKFLGTDFKSSKGQAPSGTAVQTALDYFTKRGWTKAQAAGMVVNLSKESGLNPHAIGDNGRAYGIGQWHAARQAAFKAWAGHDIRLSNLTEQLAFMQHELTQGTETAAGSLLKSAKTAAQAGAIVSKFYERPAGGSTEASARAGIATALAAKVAGASGSTHKIELSGKVTGAKVNARVTSKSDDGAETYINNLALGALPL